MGQWPRLASQVPAPAAGEILGGLAARIVPPAPASNWARPHRSRALFWLILISSWWLSCRSWHVISEVQPGLYSHPRDSIPGKTRRQAGECYTACPVPTKGKEHSPTAANPFNWVNQNTWAIARKSAKECSTGSMHIQAYCSQRGQGKGRNLVENKAAASQLY